MGFYDCDCWGLFILVSNCSIFYCIDVPLQNSIACALWVTGLGGPGDEVEWSMGLPGTGNGERTVRL